MKIYVQSSGVSEKHDYSWQGIDENQKQINEEPKLVTKFKSLIQVEAHSLLLARGENREILLLVTGMQARERTDYRSRKIRNSVAWVGRQEDEPMLRAIAVRILQSFRGQDSLKEEIDRAVKPDTEEGFQVSFDIIEAKELAQSVEVENNPPNPKSKIGLSTDEENTNELVEELQKCQLPKKTGPLVVFTGIKSPSVLQDAGVWRGYCSLEDQKKIAGSVNETALEGKKNTILIVGLLIFLIIVFCVVFQPGKEKTKPSQSHLLPYPVQKISRDVPVERLRHISQPNIFN